jgi:thermopsin
MSVRVNHLIAVLVGVIVVALLLPVSSAFGAATQSAPAAPAAAPTAAPAGPSAPTAPVATSTNPVENQVLSTLHASNAPMSKIFLPNYNPRVAIENGVVTPLYSSAPAPMGIGDFGVVRSGDVNIGTITYTDSVKASVGFGSLEPLYLDAAGPDQFTIQENTVLTHVDVMGNSSNEYWIQNVPVYYQREHLLVFEDNIWNFSSPSPIFPSNGIYAHGPLSFFEDDEVYIGIGAIQYNVAPPFTITTYNNATVYNDRPTVFFNYTLTKGGSSVSGSYDFAEFNSTGNAAPTGPSPSPTYQINGEELNPTNFLLNDAEIMIGGPGGGSTTNFLGINGSMGLWTQPNGTKKFVPVPSAYDFGTDTGETSAGIAEYWIGGDSPVVELKSGPSLLYPMWGIIGGVPSGVAEFFFDISPSNAFLFVSPGPPFNPNVAAFAIVPVSGKTSICLPPGSYTFKFLLADHTRTSMSLSGGAGFIGTPIPVTLVFAPWMGVYTPLWAFNNSQLPGISWFGSGTESSPYILYNNEYCLLDPLFGEFNDYLFPVFSGIFLVGTSAYVSVLEAPSFAIAYTIQPEATSIAELGLPVINHLEQNYFNVKHVSIVASRDITGWLFADDVGFSAASIVFWNSSDNLIAANTFRVQTEGLILFGGTNNVIWGNRFVQSLPFANNTGNIGYFNNTLALELWESGDLIYNNAFRTPFTAYTPTFNVYNGAFTIYSDTWNVSMQPATNVNYVNGWGLSGNILGLPYQSGNFWSNYGTPEDPYGVLPYNDGGLITVGGDYLPLVTHPLHAITVTETGLPSGTSWSATVNGYTQTTTATSLVFYEPRGTYAFSVSSTGYTASPASGTVTVHHSNVTLAITFS